MKKVIFAVLVLMFGFTASAHANNSGTCCVTNLPGFSQSGPLGPPQYNCCISPTRQEDCLLNNGTWHYAIYDCSVCCPTVSAGDNQTLCADEMVSLSGQVDPPVYDSAKWTTSGDGFFADDTALVTTYTPGSNDIAAGSVTLTLTVTASVQTGCVASGLGLGAEASCPPTSDSLKVTINPLPDCKITLDPDAADGSVPPGTTHTASVPSAVPVASYEWVIQDENGNNLITSPAPYGTAVNWMAPQNPGIVYINVKVIDAHGCSCTYDPPIDVKGKGILVLVTAPVPTLSGWGTAIFALLLTGLAVAVFHRRKTWK
jgi:hypothetical protein